MSGEIKTTPQVIVKALGLLMILQSIAGVLANLYAEWDRNSDLKEDGFGNLERTFGSLDYEALFVTSGIYIVVGLLTMAAAPTLAKLISK